MRMFCLLQSIFCSSIIFVFFVLYCALSCAARSTVRIPAMQRRKAHSSTALIHPGTQTQEQSFAPPWHPPPADTQTHANAHAKNKKHVTTITRDEAVCALTRAMMVPELKGEEYEALLSVLPEEQD